MIQASILSDQICKEILSSITDGFVIIAIDSKIVEINPADSAMYGYERDELIGFPVTHLIHPDYRQVFEEFLEQIIKSGTFVGASVDRRKDGSTFHVEAHGRLIHISGKDYLLSIVRDMTDHKRMEAALRESEARYEDLYENAPDMYASANAETACILGCNQTLADNLGYRKEERIGRSIFVMYHPDCQEEVKQTFDVFLETGVVRNRELQLLRKDGSKIAVSLNVTAVSDKDGKVLYSRSASRDVTEKKRAEEALHQEKGTLEKALAEIAKPGKGLPICASCKKIVYVRE